MQTRPIGIRQAKADIQPPLVVCNISFSNSETMICTFKSQSEMIEGSLGRSVIDISSGTPTSWISEHWTYELAMVSMSDTLKRFCEDVMRSRL